MILWITGERNAGKTTLAKDIQSRMPYSILLDGDAMRASITRDLGFSEEDRIENNMRIARLAKELEGQGLTVICATICPDIQTLRQDIYDECNCRFIHL